MRKQGTVVRWNGARAFGFIKSDQTPADIFFHLRDFSGASVPTEGLHVGFEEIHVGGKGPRAMHVRPLTSDQHPSNTQLPSRPRRAGPPSSLAPARAGAKRRAPETSNRAQPVGLVMALMLAWLVLLVAGAFTDRFSWWVLPLAFLLNLVTFYTYWQDKHAARQGAWRIREDTLHLLGLAGGWPGAWFSHQILRHKSSKQAFRVVYWATAILNTAALLAWVVLPLFQR
jgi:uncharacterized membrane protein YsdA (DUF1294 family)/cold shock CspA family protein